MSRTDGRTPTEIRPLALSQSLLSRADGSAKFSFGNISVVASVTGPAEVRIREELVDRARLEINALPLRGLPGPSTKSTESLLISLLTPIILLLLYPRSLIQLTVQTLSAPSTTFSHPLSTDPSDPFNAPPSSSKRLGSVGAGLSEKAAMVNAAMLSLLDAAVECKGLVLAVVVAFLEEFPGEGLLDPTPAEEAESNSAHLFAFSFGVGVGGVAGTCVAVDSRGRFTEEELFQAQDLAADACRGIMAFVRKSIEMRYGVKAEVKKVKKVVDDDEDEDDDEDVGMEE